MLRKTFRLRFDTASRRARVHRRLLMEQLGDRRVLATVSGIVFDDANESFKREASEIALQSRLVYLDQNDNGELDPGESMQLTSESGGFAFTDVADGLAVVRVFNGSSTQRQTFPIHADTLSPATEIANPTQLLVDSLGVAVLTSQSLFQVDLESSSVSGPEPFAALTKSQRLANGTLLAIGSSEGGDTSWVVDTAAGTTNAVAISVPEGVVASDPAKPWSDIAVDGSGRGVLLVQGNAETALVAVDASDVTNVVTTDSGMRLASDSSVISSLSGPRTVIAAPAENGFELSLWSNTTASMITSQPIPVSGISELLAFDDQSGLLAARSADGGVSILDVDANFAELHLFSSLTGPVAIDGARELLVALAVDDSMLQLVDLASGDSVASLSVELSEIGEASAIAFGMTPTSVVVAGSAGVAHVSLRRPAAHRVLVTDGQDPSPIVFGFVALNPNTAPGYETVPSFETEQDTQLSAPVPGVRLGAMDAQQDTFVILQDGPAANGAVTVNINGVLSYTPNDGFFGTDTFTVRLHDGRDISEPVTIEILVTPAEEPVPEVSIIMDPIPENLEVGMPVGIIEVLNVEINDNLIFVIDDPRFQVVGGQIIFVAGEIDFEAQTSFPIILTVTDRVTEAEIVEQFTVTVLDQNDPITGITPTSASVFENDPGALIAELTVLDEDVEQSHFLTVDDERFVIDLFDLRLAEGVSLDFEAGETVVVKVTATEFGTGGTFTQDITITVKDIAEQPTSLNLAGDTVEERVPGAEVGVVSLVGGSASRFTFSVDDPRFEVVDGQLKLVDDQMVELATQSEIQLEITATDSQGQFTPVSGTFVITVVAREFPYHNQDLPADVDFSGEVTAADALEIIHYLNIYGPGPVGQGDPGFGYDVNADGFVTALDALLVINALNRAQSAGNNDAVAGEPEAKKEETPAKPNDDAILEIGTEQKWSANRSAGIADSIDFEAAARDWLDSKPAPQESSAVSAVDQFLKLLDQDA